MREGVALALLASGSVYAQDPQWSASASYVATNAQGDHMETSLAGGVRIRSGDLEIRADRAFVLADIDEVPDLRSQPTGQLPRRSVSPPQPRRVLSEAVVRQRLNALLRAAKGDGAPRVQATSLSVDLIHTMYLEGNVVIMQGGRELGRAQVVHFSAVDDRTIMRNGELRLWSEGDRGPDVVIVRGDELVRQGARITGQDVSLTTCNAGEPHFEVKLGEIEVIQRDDDFEVRTADGTLAFSGVGLVPLPNTSFFAREQSNFPIQGASVGYSSTDRAQANLDLGGSFNPVGGAVHRFLTGRNAHEFRGDWHLGLGWNQERGVPLDFDLVYGAEGMYRGRFESFYLQDEGQIRREITTQFDGSAITEDQRTLLHTENRVWLGDDTTLDLSAFHSGDPAVWPEFYPREYREDELPETSAHLRHAADNVLFTLTARANATDFSYRDNRSLAPAFREELPLATFHVFSQPILALTNDIPLLLTSAGSAGYLRSDYDKTAPAAIANVDDETLRLDEELELAAPFWLGPVGFRPFAAARVTHFDNTIPGPDRTRGSFVSGIRAATRLARSWSWINDEGTRHGLRHVVSPAVSFYHRFKTDGDPSEFHQFDEVDALDEGAVLRVELLNRLQYRKRRAGPQEFLWLDLAQNVTPISDRDNQGHHLGLFEYELLLTPAADWIPVPNLRFMFEGEHDWNQGRARTFNIGTRFGRVLGLEWLAEYRTDRRTDGSIDYGATTKLFERWGVTARSQYDLGLDKTTNYQVTLVRNDHDWRIRLGVTFDTIDGDTSFHVNFEPTGGGLFKPRARQYVTGSVLDGAELGY